MYVYTVTPDGCTVGTDGAYIKDTNGGDKRNESVTASIANIPYKKQITNKNIVCELSGTVVDKGSYYILENQVLSEYIEGEGDSLIYNGSIYIAKNAQFDYINVNNEYSTNERLSFIEYISVSNGELTCLDFDEYGYIIAGTTRISS